MNYLAIGLVIIILIILYHVYFFATNTSLTSGLQELKKQVTVTYDKLKNPNSYTYSYQCWLYLSSPTNGKVQIFNRKSIDLSYSEFSVDISGQELLLNVGSGSSSPSQIMSISKNFPIQKWTYLVINVFNLKTFEAYINGKLAKTVNVSNNLTPTSHTSSLYIGTAGLNGYVSKFTRLANTLDAKTVWQTYLSGNGLSSVFSTLMPYGLNMSISKGEEVQRVVNIL